jgi:hypothetical protein
LYFYKLYSTPAEEDTQFAAMAASASGLLLLHQYYHAALPRDVPGKSDSNLFEVEAALTDRLIDAVNIIKPLASLEHQTQLDTIRLALTNSRAINIEGKIDKHVLMKELRDLERQQLLILHVTEQNCALLVYYKNFQ